MIERADTISAFFPETVACKQLMPNKTVVVFFSVVIDGAPRRHHAGFKVPAFYRSESHRQFRNHVFAFSY